MGITDSELDTLFAIHAALHAGDRARVRELVEEARKRDLEEIMAAGPMQGALDDLGTEVP